MIKDDWPQIERRLIEWWPPMRAGARPNAAAYLSALAEIPVDAVLAALKELLGTQYAPTPTEIVGALRAGVVVDPELTASQAAAMAKWAHGVPEGFRRRHPLQQSVAIRDGKDGN